MNLEQTIQYIKEADDDTLFILWTNADPTAAQLMVFMYTENSIKFNKWKNISVIIWGATTKLTAENKKIQERIRKLQDMGVHFTACITCAEELGVSKDLADLNIDLIKWLEPLTLILKNNKKLLSV